MTETTDRRVVLMAQAHRHGEATAIMQAQIQRGMEAVLGTAAGRAGLNRAEWDVLPQVGGELAVLPPSEPEPRVADAFVRRLHAALIEHNRVVAAEARVRLRLAVHFGPAHRIGEMFVGSGPGHARRLCECAAAVRVLAETDAYLVVVLSESVFTDTVADQLTSLEEEDLRLFDMKGRRAWLWAPGRELPEQVADARDDEPADDPPEEAPSVTRGPGPRGPFAGATIDNRGGKIAGRDFYDWGGRG